MTIDRKTGEIIAEHTINPDKDYQPKPAATPPTQRNDDPQHTRAKTTKNGETQRNYVSPHHTVAGEGLAAQGDFALI